MKELGVFLYLVNMILNDGLDLNVFINYRERERR